MTGSMVRLAKIPMAIFRAILPGGDHWQPMGFHGFSTVGENCFTFFFTFFLARLGSPDFRQGNPINSETVLFLLAVLVFALNSPGINIFTA